MGPSSFASCDTQWDIEDLLQPRPLRVSTLEDQHKLLDQFYILLICYVRNGYFLRIPIFYILGYMEGNLEFNV
jgi:hypothetical protein